ncbi:MAG: DUF1552 domain-containing protein [Myxococcales bacterium]|nr:DUF1552 domain-containing protein [Myxococcales bacterium]MDD9970310.1 DUF1552 domain-containing protein [Myxococcales bacterium]
MKTSHLSRRMFLQGSGGALLAIPSMVSLLPRAARAQEAASAPPVRYVQWITNHGQFKQHFWPADRFAPNETEADTGVKFRPLSEISGPMSTVLSSAFDPFRGKMNVLRGLDLMASKNFHNACAPTCGSWPRVDNHIPEFSHSVDSILEKSSIVYPNTVAVPALRLTPGVASSFKWGSFCWTTKNGKPFKLPCYDDTGAALNAVFPKSGRAGGAGNGASERDRLTDQVIEDYRSVVNGGAISANDRQQLSNYMDLLADLQNRQSAAAPSCDAPDQVRENNFDALHENATDIAVAAMLCGATRVVAYHCFQGARNSYDEPTYHGWAHGDAAKHGPMQAYRYKHLAMMLEKMDAFTERDGNTLLDNAVVYSCNELSQPGHGSEHLEDMPVMLAGSAGGQLTTGNYIDFDDRLLNNLLITMFHVMGLTSPDDYEQRNVVGFGDYQGDNANRYRAWVSDAERRKPLPFLFKA